MRHHNLSHCIIQRSRSRRECRGRLINAIRPLFHLPLLRPPRVGSYRRGQSSTDKAGNPARVSRYQRDATPTFFRARRCCPPLSFPPRSRSTFRCRAECIRLIVSRLSLSRTERPLFLSRGGISSSRLRVFFSLAASVIPGKSFRTTVAKPFLLSAYPYLRLLKTVTSNPSSSASSSRLAGWLALP